MSYNFEKFLITQSFCYERALNEIKNGRKESQWMWFIFPQLKSLEHSEISKLYGISDLNEAKAYIEHPILGKRLREITSALLSLDENNPIKVMRRPDHLKLCASMTLFAKATDNNKVFVDVLKKFYNGYMDVFTLCIINEQGECYVKE